MIINELTFECFDNTTFSHVDTAINGLLDALRYNGQILGREFPILYQDGKFVLRVVCPENDSLAAKYHSPQVKAKLKSLSSAFLLSPKIKILGRDINSEQSAENFTPTWQVLYTSYVHTCSPLRSGEDLLPIPLYQIPAVFNGDQKALVKWQTEWQACDEIQMAGAFKAEFAALDEIQSPESLLFRKGWDLRGRVEYLTKVPTYYYQYRVGGTERDRCCPKCGGDWKLAQPLHDIFYFKCDDCRLVSNLSWDFQ